MATFEDAAILFQKEKNFWDLFGASKEWREKVIAAIRKIGAAMMRERGIGAREAKLLPIETKLGPKAAEAFEEFRALMENEYKRRQEAMPKN